MHIDSFTKYFVNSKHPVRKTCQSSFPLFRIWGSTRLGFGKYITHVNFWFDVLDVWLKNVKVDVPGKKISFCYVGNDSKKEFVGKNMMPTDQHKSLVSNGKRGEKLWLKIRTGHFCLNLQM